MDAKKLEKETLKTIQRNIRNRRSELGITQGDLAKKLGVSRQGITIIENREYGINLSTLAKLAISLDISIINLISEENDED